MNDSNESNERIMLLVTPFSENGKVFQEQAEKIFYKLNDTLQGEKEFLTAQNVYEYCKNKFEHLVPYIRNACTDVIKKTISCGKQGVNFLNGISKKKLRVLLYPGEKSDLDNLNVNEATHNMVVRFDDAESNFIPAEPHKNFPIFYQNCISEEIAVLYIEALLIDAYMCHRMGVSDAAMHHKIKQEISKEKVEFIKYICEKNDFGKIVPDAQDLIKFVCSKLKDDTPYISFLSIFTIAIRDFNPEKVDIKDNITTYFDEYYELWCAFQVWYYRKKKLVFSKEEDVVDPISKIFNNSKFQGQISPEEATKAIINEIKCLKKNKKIEDEIIATRYVFVILKKMPLNDEQYKICDALFKGHLHQSKWKIIKWDRISDFYPIEHLISVVPFIIEV